VVKAESPVIQNLRTLTVPGTESENMSKRKLAIRKDLTAEVGKSNIADVKQVDIDRLWRKRGSKVEVTDEELDEIFNWTAEGLLELFTLSTGACSWDQVSNNALKQFPREGLSACQKFVLDELCKHKRYSRVEQLIAEMESNRSNCSFRKPVSNSVVNRTEEKQYSVRTAYHGSNATATKRLYSRLKGKGIDGEVAAALLRVQKSSSRAKKYRGDCKEHSYHRKAECLVKLCETLSRANFMWGWAEDTGSVNPRHVLYVELPDGQVSFHAIMRGEGPDFSAPWDGQHSSEERILQFAERMIEDESLT